MPWNVSELIGPSSRWKPREIFSASQLDMYLRCPRKWAFRYVDGVKEARKTKGLLLGSLIHASLESYMLGGTVYQQHIPANLGPETLNHTEAELAEMQAEASRRALATLHLLPNRGECDVVQVETEIAIDTRKIAPDLEPLAFRGLIDLSYRRSGVWYFHDYKSTKGRTRKDGDLPKDPWAYVKTADELQRDPQGVLYSLDRMYRCQTSDIWARWNYILTDPKKHPDAKATDVHFTCDAVRPWARYLFALANDMRQIIRSGVSARDVPISGRTSPLDPGSPCRDFGGCPYRAEAGGPCRVSDQLDFGAFLLHPENTMSDPLTEATNAAAQAATAAIPAQGVAQPPAGPAGLPALPSGWVYDAAGNPVAAPATAAPAQPPPPAAPAQQAPAPPAPEAAAAPPAEPAPPAPPAEPATKARTKGRPKKPTAPVVRIVVERPDGSTMSLPVADDTFAANLIDFVRKQMAI